jgi:hypothetical protein
MGFELTTLVLIGTDYIGSCKSNYHTIMTTTTPCTIVILPVNTLFTIYFYIENGFFDF